MKGTAKRAQLEGYTAAGKTGTAQKIDPKTRAYSKTKYVASFVGFAPVENPAVVIIVVIDEPVGSVPRRRRWPRPSSARSPTRFCLTST